MVFFFLFVSNSNSRPKYESITTHGKDEIPLKLDELGWMDDLKHETRKAEYTGLTVLSTCKSYITVMLQFNQVTNFAILCFLSGLLRDDYICSMIQL